jgi:DNA-directed RNA polymerase subunit M/transcription elongation factor TFIIS
MKQKMIRTRIFKQLMEIPGLPETTGKNIEISVYNHAIGYANTHNIEAVWTNFIFKHLYVSKAQEILASLRDSPEFIQQVVREKLSTEIATYHKKQIKKNKLDHDSSSSSGTEAVSDGIFKCRKCGSRQTTYYSVQIRCQDEPATNFITCLNCENRWKN